MSLDINDLSLMNEVIEVDDTVSPEEFFNPPLTDDGDYRVVLKLGNRGITVDRQKDAQGNKTGAPFIGVHLQLVKIGDNGEEAGTIAFDDVSTVVFDSSVGRTSRAHMTFAAAGFPITEKSLGGIKTQLEQTMAQSPQAIVTTQWQAEGEDTSQPKNSKKRYVSLLKGQKKFPKMLDASGNETGRFDPEVTDPKTGLSGRARVKVVKYAKT